MQPPVWTTAHADRIAAAKLWVISSPTGDLPYLATALYAMPTVASPRVATCTVDRSWRLYVNPDWLEGTEVPLIGAHVAHLAWHLLADHSGRAADVGVTAQTAKHWRTASDVTIEQVLPWPGPELPSAQALNLPPDRSAEEYYAMLSGLPVATEEDDGRANPLCGSGCDGLARPDEVSDVPGVDEMPATAIRKQVAIDFIEHQRNVGTTPGEWDRWVQRVLTPVVPWQQVLRSNVRRGIGWSQGDTDYTYSRISRRQSVAGTVILPALRRPTPAVAIVIDTSGSIDDTLLAQALGEVDAVLDSLAVPDSSVHTLVVDAAVHSVARIRDISQIKLSGGGGTDMTLGLAAAAALRPRPQIIVILTDGLTRWPATPPEAAVVIGLLGHRRAELPDTPTWAQRVEVVPG